MKCDLCNKPAVVHEVTVKNGVKREIHLCEAHAKESGIAVPAAPPIGQLLTQFVISQTSKPAKTINKSCSLCGLSFNQFRQAGKVGCPECYRTFEEQLSPLIERAQSGGTHHCGKSPRRSGHSLDRQLLVQKLMKELDLAVAAEQYERAAKLRDRLATMNIATRATGTPARSDKAQA